MKLKEGKKVKIKSLDWYNNNKDKDGAIDIGPVFIKPMSKFCGKYVTINEIHYIESKKMFYFSIKESHYNFCSSFIDDRKLSISIKIN